MSKRHDAVFDDVLKGLVPAAAEEGRAEEHRADRGATRFLNRANALAEAGEREEKVLRWGEPGQCRMWARHNRAYELLTESNCRDLIDSIKAQGRQEFPAVVRRLPAGQGAEYEVICGARRHFAISWLNAHNYPQLRYLIDVRDLTDEEAFRLADLENRDRVDISDFERARDYAGALALYYDGRQKDMAARLEVSETWLSRYLNLARLPEGLVAAFASIHDLKEAHARRLRPLLDDPDGKARMLAEADRLAASQAAARAGQGEAVAAGAVLTALQAAGKPETKAGPREAAERVFRRSPGESGIRMRRKGGKITLEFNETLSTGALRAAFEQFLTARSGGKS